MSAFAAGTTNTRAFVEALSYANCPLKRTPERDNALLATYKHLLTHRTASRLGFVANVYPRRDAGLGPTEWYESLVSPLLRELPCVSPPGPGTAVWRYAPE